MKKMAWILSLLASITFLGACENQDEMNKIASAQKCLNEIDEDSASLSNDLARCRSKLGNAKSDMAYIVRCGIEFLDGGLTTQRIVNAYENLNNAGSNQEAYFFVALTLESEAAADAVFDACTKSGVQGLSYLAGLARSGTYLASSVPGVFANWGNPDFPSPLDVSTIVSACESNPAACASDEMAESIVAVADSYCDGSKADSDVCEKINDAVDSGNAAEAISCLLAGKQYNVDGTCSP